MKKLSLKQRAWLRALLDQANPATFMNQSGAARAAGYKCKNDLDFASIGYQNSIKLQEHIAKWQDEVGLSDEALKTRLLKLMDAKETKFIKVKGAINQDDLLPGFFIVGTTGTIEWDKDGKCYGEGDTILMVNMDALEVQRRSLDMGFKVNGTYESVPIKDVLINVRVEHEE